MLWLLALLLLLVLLFGGLGLFVAKAFFVVLLVALLIGLLMGGFGYSRRGGSHHGGHDVV
jgi:hypothetical protein